MDIYLPIAEVAVNAPLIVALGALVGFISGMFGIGGGFLMTPMLVFLGIPAPVAVSSMANHVAASSMSSVIAYSRRRAVDLRMGAVLAAGGIVGAIAGVELFRWLRLLGQADLVVSVSYLLFLGAIGGLMLKESLGAILRRRRGAPAAPRRDRRPVWLYGLPLKMRFPRSRLYISVIPPLALGGFVGVLSAIMGVGGGFILQAGRNQTVDIVLASLLIVGGIVGAQYGARASYRFRAEELRAILALIVLAVGLRGR